MILTSFLSLSPLVSHTIIEAFHWLDSHRSVLLGKTFCPYFQVNISSIRNAILEPLWGSTAPPVTQVVDACYALINCVSLIKSH